MRAYKLYIQLRAGLGRRHCSHLSNGYSSRVIRRGRERERERICVCLYVYGFVMGSTAIEGVANIIEFIVRS